MPDILAKHVWPELSTDQLYNTCVKARTTHVRTRYAVRGEHTSSIRTDGGQNTIIATGQKLTVINDGGQCNRHTNGHINDARDYERP